MSTFDPKIFRQLVIDVLTAIQGKDYILCGGLAMQYHSRDRVTTDIDLLVNDIASIAALLVPLGFIWTGETFRFEEWFNPIDTDIGRLPHKKYIIPVDLIKRAGLYLSVESESGIFMGVPTQVATRSGMILMKSNSTRDRDRDDLMFLER